MNTHRVSPGRSQNDEQTEHFPHPPAQRTADTPNYGRPAITSPTLAARNRGDRANAPNPSPALAAEIRRASPARRMPFGIIAALLAIQRIYVRLVKTPKVSVLTRSLSRARRMAKVLPYPRCSTLSAAIEDVCRKRGGA
jgi:hypothetical protein